MGIFGRGSNKPPPGAAAGKTSTPSAPPPSPADEDPLSTLWSRPPNAAPSSAPLAHAPPEPSRSGLVAFESEPMSRRSPRVPSAASDLVAFEPEPMTVTEALRPRAAKQTLPTASEQLRRRPPMPPPPPPSGPPRLSPIPPRASSAPPRISSNPPASRDPSIHPAADPLAMMRLARSAGDHHTALLMAESILAHEPGHADAARCAAECRDRLFDAYSRKLGARSRTLRIVVPPEKIPRLTIDHRSAFLLSRIDGVSSIEEVLDVSGMPMLDAMRVLAELLDQRLVAPDEPPPSREPGRIPR